MTVHGAKGLEAPIVFLPDTCSTRSAAAAEWVARCWRTPTRPSGMPPPFLWPVKGTSKVVPMQAARGRCGAAEPRSATACSTWRSRARATGCTWRASRARRAPLARLLVQPHQGRLGRVDLKEVAGRDGRTVWRLRSEQTVPSRQPARRAPAATAGAVPLPAWAKPKAPPEPMLTMPLGPLAPGAAGGPQPRRASRAAAPRRRYAGAAAVLPRCSWRTTAASCAARSSTPCSSTCRRCRSATWAAAAEAFLARPGDPLPRRGAQGHRDRDAGGAAGAGASRRCSAPTAAPRWRSPPRCRGPDGKGPALRLTGKIDRLARDGDTVLIVDYKTNRPPPGRRAAVPEAYLLQLAAYRLGIARIFPGKRSEAAILWTDGPRIHGNAASRLDAFSAASGRRLLAA